MNANLFSHRVIAKKACNALIEDAKVDINKWVVPTVAAGLVTGNLSFAGSAIIAGTVPSIYKRMFNGLWVGGSAILTDAEFVFVPNKLNAALHKEVLSLKIPLESIHSVEKKFGLVSGIIEIEAQQGILKLRVMNAKSFCNMINETRNSMK